MPELLDRLDRLAEGLGQRHPHQAGRDADARRTAQELQQRPAAGGIQPVEPVRQLLRLFGAAPSVEARGRSRQDRERVLPAHRPSQISASVSAVSPTSSRDRRKSSGSKWRPASSPRTRRSGKRQRQSIGERGQRIAAVGIGRRTGSSRATASACQCATACRRGGRGVRRSPSFGVILAADQRQRAGRDAPSA